MTQKHRSNDDEDQIRKPQPYKRHGRQEKETAYRKHKKETFHERRFWSESAAYAMLSKLQTMNYPASCVQEGQLFIVTWYGYSI